MAAHDVLGRAPVDTLQLLLGYLVPLVVGHAFLRDGLNEYHAAGRGRVRPLESFVTLDVVVVRASGGRAGRGGCSTGSAGPRPRPSRPASGRRAGLRVATGRRHRASTRPEGSPRPRARRARRRRGAGSPAPAARRSATRSGRRSGSMRRRPCHLARSPRPSTAGGTGGARGGTPAPRAGPRPRPDCPPPPVPAPA